MKRRFAKSANFEGPVAHVLLSNDSATHTAMWNRLGREFGTVGIFERPGIVSGFQFAVAVGARTGDWLNEKPVRREEVLGAVDAIVAAKGPGTRVKICNTQPFSVFEGLPDALFDERELV